MERYRGTSVLKQIAIGRIFFYGGQENGPYREEAGDAGSEIARFDAAREAALGELDALILQTEQQAGAEEAEIFFGHRMLVKDPLYRDYVCDRIRKQRVNAAYAVADAQAHFMQMLLAVDDTYMRERASDVADISKRLLRLLGGGTEPESPAEPSILAARELTPSEIMRFDRSDVLALVVQKGSLSSHMAILARSANIPAVLGVDVSEEWDGRMAVVDGCSGEVILDPDEECLARMREKQSELRERDALREALRGRETVTGSGRRIGLYANVGDAADVDDALANGAEGIGLFRSEFLYLQARNWPAEEEQFETYRAVACAMGERRVVIRTLDVGADKQLPYLETNSRGIRLCLDRPDMFRTQLRAILRAAAYGSVAVMFPMIGCAEELRAGKEQLALARKELADAGIPFGDAECGIMVETPEAVRLSAQLAREADFFSIGTNDLIPLLLGKERQKIGPGDGDLANPVVMQAIRTTVENAHAAGIRVGVCGEMAADTDQTEKLIGTGIDELSVAPASILKVREKVRGIC